MEEKKEYFWKNKRTAYFCQSCCNQGKQDKQNEFETCDAVCCWNVSFVVCKEKFQGRLI